MSAPNKWRVGFDEWRRKAEALYGELRAEQAAREAAEQERDTAMSTMSGALDDYEAERRLTEALVAALQPFADETFFIGKVFVDEDPVKNWPVCTKLTVGDFRRARRILKARGVQDRADR